jgi:O-antigen ligase
LNHFRHVYRAPDWMREGTRESAHAHNIWLQTALDLGLVGLVLYVAVLALLLRRAAAVARADSDTARRLALGSALGLVGVHLFGMADAVSLGAKVGLFQWILAGFILAASHLARPAGARA